MKSFLRTMSSGIVAAGLLLPGLSLAHETTGPHGGKVSDFGDKYHMEAVVEGDSAHFYLLDGNAKAATLESHDGGTITLLVSGQGPGTTEIAKGKPFSEATAPLPGKGKITATVSLKTGAKSHMAKFRLDAK